MQRNANWGFSRRSALGLAAAIGGIGYLCGGDAPGGTTVALAAAMLLNLSILAHEAGHLAAARAMGVAVQEFSVGIGPRVAWWQGRTTTYCLRAMPLLGFVSFLTSAQLAAAGGCVYGGMYGSRASAAGAAGAHAQAPRLLESLSPGRRAVVMAAGVAANVVLAAAFVGWQVLSYGEVGRVVRPGALVYRIGGWMSGSGGEDEEKAEEEGGEAAGTAAAVAREAGAAAGAAAAAAAREPAGGLRAGDVILSVGRWQLPTGGEMDEAIVLALSEAAGEARAAATAAATAAAAAAAADCDAAGPECQQAAHRSAAHCLDGVKMAVLRTRRAGDDDGDGAGGGGGLVPSRTVVHLNAADVLRYDTLHVTPNLRVGYRQPKDEWEALCMTGRELLRWTERILDCWREILTGGSGGTAVASAAAGGGGGGGDGGGGGGGGGTRFMGPLGLVASAAGLVADAERYKQTGISTSTSNSSSSSSSSSSSNCTINSSGSSSGGTADGSGDSGDPLDDNALLDESIVRQPHPLLGLGVQLNLQLALFNLLPVPALDGGQLLLVALEALRGGRRLGPSLERAALLSSALLMGGWLAVLSVRDAVGLMDRAACRLAAAVEPYYGLYGTGYGNHHYHHRGPHRRGGAGGGAGGGHDTSSADEGLEVSSAEAAVATGALAL